jgi:hypothetical protein
MRLTPLKWVARSGRVSSGSKNTIARRLKDIGRYKEESGNERALPGSNGSYWGTFGSAAMSDLSG